jgi:outer membrane protein OmpA-like peptidoglycan-associated protein
MTGRFRLTTWVAFADFFAALAVISIALYAVHRRGDIRVPPELKLLVDKLQTELSEEGIKTELDEINYSLNLPETALMDFGKWDLPNAETPRRIARAIKKVAGVWPAEYILMIRGHADAHQKQPGINRYISSKRAEVLGDALAAEGIRPPQYQVATQGVGEFEPVVDNCVRPGPSMYDCGGPGNLKSPKLLAANRRIELRFGHFSGKSGVR